MPLIGSLEILSSASTGVNLGAQTQHGIAIGEGPNVPLNWIVLSSGELLVGNTGADPTPASLTPGSGISISYASGSPGTITITNTKPGGGSGFVWTPVSGPTTMTPDTGYIPNGGGTVILTMPNPGTSSVGDTTQVVGNGAMWVILANGNTINFLSDTVSASLASTTVYDAISMLCVAPNTFVVNSSEGNITVI